MAPNPSPETVSLSPGDAMACSRWFSRWRRVVVSLAALALAIPVLAAGAQPAPVDHLWRRVFYGQLDGKERLLFSSPIDRAKPALGDLDGDGDDDMLVGSADGTLRYFQNDGGRNNPSWRLLREQVVTSPERSKSGKIPLGEVIHVGAQAAPALVDIDGDMDLDLFIGAGDGRLQFFRNAGNRYLPLFRRESTDFLGRRLGRDLVVRFADANTDGNPDIILGNAEGEVYFLVNQGSRSEARFCPRPKPVPPSCLQPPRKLGQLSPEDHAVPAWVDWDGDGDLDIAVGRSDGKLNFYRNIGSRRNGSWELAEERFQILDAGGYAAPLFAELTGDNKVELLLAGDGDGVSFYTVRDGRAGPQVWLLDDNLLRAARLGRFQSRLQVTSGDLDGDGDSDLVIGTRGGNLLIYYNVGSKGQVGLRGAGGPLLPTPHRAFSSPALVDIDGDKDLDLIVGDRNGRLEWIENIGSSRRPRWQIRDLHFGGVDVGSYSVPAFGDLNGDAAVDLLVGNSLGKIVLFRNKGSRTRPVLELKSVEFGPGLARRNAAPAFFAYEPGRPPDLVLGGRSGRVRSAVRDPRVAVMADNSYRGGQAPWRGIAARGYSAPHFVDLTGDKRSDLLLGGVESHLSLWQYMGSRKRKMIAGARQAPSSATVQPSVPREQPQPQAGAPARPSSITGPAAEAPLVADVPVQPEANGLAPIFVRGAPLSTPPSLRNTRPAAFDADGDGRQDLVVGTAKGRLLVYRNTGQRGGSWPLLQGTFAGISAGRGAAPAFGDVDRDGDLDLLVGTEVGRVVLFENTGRDGRARWKQRDELLRNVRVGKNAVPAFAEIMRPGTLDLLVGNLQGRVYLYTREPGKAIRFKLQTRRFLQLDVGVNASPAVASLAGRSNKVLLVGSDGGPVTILQEKGRKPLVRDSWRVRRSFVEGLKMPLGSHPAVLDADGDGDLDLFVGSDGGKILYFENNAIAPRTARK